MKRVKKALNKEIHWLAAGLIIGIISTSVSWGLSVRAAGGPPSFGGTVTFYNPACILDTPVILPVTCALSCPLCTGLLGTLCVGFQEVRFAPAGGSAYSFLCVPKGYGFIGGAPTVGGQLLGNGLQMFPIQVGVGPTSAGDYGGNAPDIQYKTAPR